MELVDELRPFISLNPNSPRPCNSAEEKVWQSQCYIYIYIFWVSFSLRFLDWVICFFLIVCFNARSHCS